VTEPLVLPLGESALTIRLGDVASVENSERAAALAEVIRQGKIDGVREVVSAVASVTVFYDAQNENGETRSAMLRDFVAHLPSMTVSTAAFATHTIPTRYDGADLDEVAARVGLSRDEVIRRHVTGEYHVLAIGFLPGWAYLGPLDASLSLPRRSTPRTRIPAGAVAIMGAQTGIYPRVSPGGWNLIGSTDVVLFDANRSRPALFHAGDRVRFIQVA
jgi:KipI family sensor histidine kinase inhibitor